ncbi:MAG: TolC family protein, partial [Akkermansiaceae bacterium]|nr:TolC family protein [Akkermansiaceae bacterium]
MTPPAGGALPRLSPLLSTALLVAGCAAVGPDYEPPAISTPDEWTYAISADLVSSRTGAQRWWRQFDDATLNRLIARSRSDNPNVKRARARIAEGWYQRGVLAAAFYPHTDFYGRDEYGMGTFDSDGVKFDAGSSHDQLAQIDAGWEIDLFGRIRRQVEAADAEWEARTEGWRDALVFITAEVALHYIALRTLEDRIEVAEEAVTTFRDIHELTVGREEEGLAAKVDVSESKARLRTSEADVPQLRK